LNTRSIWVNKRVIRRKLPPVTRMMAATTSGAGASANEPEARAVPVLLKKGLHLRSRERPEFVHEADPREELRVACGSLLEPGPGMPMSTMPKPVWSNTERSCSRLGMESRSASSMTMSEVGSGIALFFASYSSKVWKYVGVKGERHWSPSVTSEKREVLYPL
jgi:hypothetical protein